MIFRPFWPAVSRLPFVSVSLALNVTKIATVRHKYSLASRILRHILKACWPRCAFGRLSRKNPSRFVNAWTVSTLPYRERFVEFCSAYALRWNKVRLPRSHRTSESSLYVIDGPCWFTDWRLLLHEYNVYLLISFVESMATHSSHSSYKIVMTGLLGESSEGLYSKL